MHITVLRKGPYKLFGSFLLNFQMKIDYDFKLIGLYSATSHNEHQLV